MFVCVCAHVNPDDVTQRSAQKAKLLRKLSVSENVTQRSAIHAEGDLNTQAVAIVTTHNAPTRLAAAVLLSVFNINAHFGKTHDCKTSSPFPPAWTPFVQYI